MLSEQEEKEGLARLGLTRATSRRGFLKLGASAGLSLAMVSAFGSVVRASGFNASTSGLLIMTNAKGMILGDPTRCVGCRRCELACTEFNDGKSQPSIARVQVGRNYNFGPKGASTGFWRGEGEYGNFRLIQETCQQCPHPVPCATACAQGAIAADPTTGARVVDASKCIGCQLCEGACPWEMIHVDPDTKKATKCVLCGECVAACPTGALKMVSWRDRTKDTPPRQSAMKVVGSAAVKEGCGPCHGKP